MGNCCSRFKSSESTTMDSSLPTTGDPVPSPPVDSSLPTSSGDPVPPPVDSSLPPSSGDPVRPSTNAIESIGEMYKNMDPELMDSSLPTTGDPVPSPPVDSSLPTCSGDPVPPPLVDPSPPSTDAIESIREIYDSIDPVEQIESLISFVEYHLEKMKTPSEAGSSSAEGWLDTVRDGTKLAAKAVDAISKEAENISTSDAVGNITSNGIKGVGDSYWVIIGLSVAAYAVEKYLSVGSTEKECREILMNILQLANDVKRVSDVNEMLSNAVGIIVEGAVIFCGYMDLKRGKTCRFLSATTAVVQLEKANKHLRDLMDSHALPLLQQNWDKDVFLSHSGEQKDFVRQLREDLIREHVSCFFDEDLNSLPFAEKFPSLMLKAAETCKIAVVVLSNKFIISKWPMIELSAFFRAIKSTKNAKLKIIPIFYDISPRELPLIEKYKPEWQNLKVSNYTRSQWEAALKEVRSDNGSDFSKDGNEVRCRGKVVKEICRILMGLKPPMLLEIEPVGIEKQVLDVTALLDIGGAKPALAVNVCGHGGMGKSTVAASVVQSLDWSSLDFKFCRVAIDRKANDKAFHIRDLQKIILSYLAGVNDDLRDSLDGRQKIKAALVNKRSLLLIDNVVDKDDIEVLLPRDLSYSGQNTKLRIIITCRAKDVKAKLDIHWEEYEVKGLSDETSKNFLSKTIKKSQQVQNLDPEEEERLINKVAIACRGIPLLLSVFGQHLKTERNTDSYQEALEVLRKGNLNSYRDEELGTTLMHVYNKIKDVETKEIFLDICAYFHGWKWNVVADIVERRKLEDLQRRMLVSKGDLGEVIVHDILLLMGMNEAEHTRFSNWEKLSDALESNLNGPVIVKGISLLDNDISLIKIHSTKLEAMHQYLRVLMLGDWVTLEAPLCQKAFRNLRFLHVGDITTFPFEDPSKLEKLNVLVNRSKAGMNLSHLPSSLKRISHEVPHVECDKFEKLPFQKLSSLKNFMVKTSKSVELPEEIHLPSSLVDLHLERCKNLPKDMDHLIALESLILDRSDLEYLPQGFGKLQKLKHLSLNYCSKLAFLSEELGMLSSLEALSMNGCKNLRALPESFGGLHSLQTLEFDGCINLHELPESLGELRVQSLNLLSLVNLNKLPDSFGNMPFLKNLKLESSYSLMSLPKSFVQLKLLETLEIMECTKLSILPEDFGRLTCLKHMTVQDCDLLKELPHEFGALPALKTFKLERCHSFVNLPRGFAELTSLEKLWLYYLPLMSSIPDGFGNLKKLRFLNVCYCDQLKTLSDDFEDMATLETLIIESCPELDGALMEKIVKLPNCYMAQIEGSTKLIEKWEHMQGETEHPFVVFSGDSERDWEHAMRAALLNGKCMELNNSRDEVVERSSLLVGLELEEGTTATVALIMLPVHMQSDEHQTLQQIVKMARERAERNGSGELQIVCAIKEEEEEEEDSIRQILLLLPKGSCVIPSSQSKRVKLLTECCKWFDYRFEERSFLMANVGVDMKFTRWEDNSDNASSSSEMSEEENNSNSNRRQPQTTKENYYSIQNFIQSICAGQYRFQSECVEGKSKTAEFTEALKGDGIHYLLSDNGQSQLLVSIQGFLQIHALLGVLLITPLLFSATLRFPPCTSLLPESTTSVWHFSLALHPPRVLLCVLLILYDSCIL